MKATSLISKINVVAIRKQRKYDRMIAESQAKLAETKLVPGYTKIWC